MSEKKKIKKRRPRSKPGELPQILKTKHGSAYMNYMGRRYFLGTYGSEEAEQKRRQIVAEFDAALGVCPQRRSPITVEMLILRFLNHAKQHYTKNGRSTGSYERFKRALKPVLKLYAELSVADFKPLALKAVRQIMIDSGKLCRKTINTRIGLIRQVFHWGVGNELVPPENLTALEAVSGLRKREANVPERPPVLAVKKTVVLKTLPLLSQAIGDMVRLQLRTGMRPGEVVQMRPADLYREGDELPDGYDFQGFQGCWVYIPEEHKTEHHNKIRFVFLNEACQEILEPYLKRRGHEEFIFCPAAEQELRLAKMRESRKSKVQPSQECRKRPDPKRKPGQKYTVNSYRTSIQRAIERHNERILLGEMEGERGERLKILTEIRGELTEKTGRKPTVKELAARLGISSKELIPQWFPNQLRHYFATLVRKIAGLEGAQVVMGHSRLSTTEIYAEKIIEKALDVALQTNDRID